MVIDNKRRRAKTTDHDESQSSSEVVPDSPPGGDDSKDTINAPSHLSVKKRRSIMKRVVSMKIGEAEGLRIKGETYPPSDLWAWRKYGQKPIKGSPYPRGYYRCSSSKGCPARKQVERNRMDPTTLIVTYAYEHNHPMPTTKHHHLNRPRATDTRTPSTTDVISPTTPSATTTTISDEDSTPASPVFQINKNPFGDPPQLEFVKDSLVLESLEIEYNWVYHGSSFRTPFIVGPSCDDDGEVVAFSMREEDESLFGDLGELPECSLASFSNKCL